MRDPWGNKIPKEDEHKWSEFDCSAAVEFALKGHARTIAAGIKAQLEKDESKKS